MLNGQGTGHYRAATDGEKNTDTGKRAATSKSGESDEHVYDDDEDEQNNEDIDNNSQKRAFKKLFTILTELFKRE